MVNGTRRTVESPMKLSSCDSGHQSDRMLTDSTRAPGRNDVADLAADWSADRSRIDAGSSGALHQACLAGGAGTNGHSFRVRAPQSRDRDPAYQLVASTCNIGNRPLAHAFAVTTTAGETLPCELVPSATSRPGARHPLCAEVVSELVAAAIGARRRTGRWLRRWVRAQTLGAL